MRKRLILLFVFAVLCIIGLRIIPNDSNDPHIQIMNGEIRLSVNADDKNIVLSPWLDEESGIYYFFMPSFVKNRQIITGMWNKPVLNWKENEVYEIKVSYDGQIISYPVSFMKSSTISSIYINTESGSMDAIHADKEYAESGDILIITASGNTEYEGNLERISGRGNTSWSYAKKPYSIKLAESQKLCGLQKGRKWILLPVWREGNKMNTKVLFDIASAAGLQYTPESTWVDLYLNNEYVGIYLLSESVSVSGGRVEITDLEDENELCNPDLVQAVWFEENNAKGYELSNNPENISGGYLIEKDLEAYYKEEKVGFVTNSGANFTITAPQHASREQVNYIKDYVQNIENLLSEKSEDADKYIDIDSFSAKYLIDEISLNFDTNITSMYFYKERDDDLLYAGPVWDYDSALGECNAGYAEGWFVDYNNSILDRNSELMWYSQLYEYDTFQKSVRKQYKILLPYLREMLDNTIDLYANSIVDSVAMDNVRWKNEDVDKPGNYEDFQNNVRYLKYFLSARLNWLNNRLGVSNYNFRWSGTGEMHEVVFMNGDSIVESIQVKDGETLEELPYLEEEKYWGWYFEYNNEKYRAQLPILEDTVLYAREKD